LYFVYFKLILTDFTKFVILVKIIFFREHEKAIKDLAAEQKSTIQNLKLYIESVKVLDTEIKDLAKELALEKEKSEKLNVSLDEANLLLQK
jgi:hypothetical protein